MITLVLLVCATAISVMPDLDDGPESITFPRHLDVRVPVWSKEPIQFVQSPALASMRIESEQNFRRLDPEIRQSIEEDEQAIRGRISGVNLAQYVDRNRSLGVPMRSLALYAALGSDERVSRRLCKNLYISCLPDLISARQYAEVLRAGGDVFGRLDWLDKTCHQLMNQQDELVLGCDVGRAWFNYASGPIFTHVVEEAIYFEVFHALGDLERATRMAETLIRFSEKTTKRLATEKWAASGFADVSRTYGGEKNTAFWTSLVRGAALARSERVAHEILAVARQSMDATAYQPLEDSAVRLPRHLDLDLPPTDGRVVCLEPTPAFKELQQLCNTQLRELSVEARQHLDEEAKSVAVNYSDSQFVMCASRNTALQVQARTLALYVELTSDSSRSRLECRKIFEVSLPDLFRAGQDAEIVRAAGDILGRLSWLEADYRREEARYKRLFHGFPVREPKIHEAIFEDIIRHRIYLEPLLAIGQTDRAADLVGALIRISENATAMAKHRRSRFLENFSYRNRSDLPYWTSLVVGAVQANSSKFKDRYLEAARLALSESEYEQLHAIATD